MARAEGAKARVAILYHSGSGGTELAARLVAEALAPRREVTVASVGDPAAAAVAREADFLALFFPTFFLRPSPSMSEFIASLGPFERPRPAYAVATCELYTENCVRAAALALRERGAVLTGSKALRAPGSDVSCVLPAFLIPWLYRFERRFPRKVLEIASEIDELAGREAPVPAIPAPKWYTPFARVLQIPMDRFEAFRDRFLVLGERCTACGACVAACERRAWSMEGGRPRHDAGRCDLCTRCVHRCPSRAIVLLRALKDNPRLDRRLYAALGEEARRRVAEEASRWRR